jgi:hypothetical protein
MSLLMRVSTLDDAVATDRELDMVRCGWAVLRVRPNFRENGQVLWADLVEALGHDVTSSFRARADAHSKAVALSWLAAGPVEDLIVAGAHLLPPKSLTELATLVTGAGVRAWLLYDIEPCDEREMAERQLGPTHVPLSDFLHRRREAAEAPERTGSEPFPEVPDVHFMGFLETAALVVDPDKLPQVRERYGDGLQSMLDRFGNGAEIDEHGLAMMLHELTHDTNDLNELTCLVKGAQAAMLRRGWYARVDVGQWARRGAVAGLSQSLTSSEWAALSTLYRPQEAAACALSTMGVSVEEMPELDISQISNDGSLVRCGEEEIVVPEPARQLLVAQLIHRELAPAASDRFLVAGPKEPQVSDKWAGRLLRLVTRDTGVLLRGWHASRQSMSTAGWTHRLGLSVTRLEP